LRSQRHDHRFPCQQRIFQRLRDDFTLSAIFAEGGHHAEDIRAGGLCPHLGARGFRRIEKRL